MGSYFCCSGWAVLFIQNYQLKFSSGTKKNHHDETFLHESGTWNYWIANFPPFSPVALSSPEMESSKNTFHAHWSVKPVVTGTVTCLLSYQGYHAVNWVTWRWTSRSSYHSLKFWSTQIAQSMLCLLLGWMRQLVVWFARMSYTEQESRLGFYFSLRWSCCVFSRLLIRFLYSHFFPTILNDFKATNAVPGYRVLRCGKL